MGSLAILALLGLGLSLTLTNNDDPEAPDDTSEDVAEDETTPINVEAGATAQGTDADDIFQIAAGSLIESEFTRLNGVTVDGGAGDDTINLTSSGDVALTNGSLNGGAGDDVIALDLVYGDVDGGAGDDTLTIDGGAVTINGGAGDDVVVASSTSGEFHRVFGGDGDDTLTGDYNAILEGGAGDDLLIYNGNTEPGSGARVTGDGGAGDDTLRVDVSAQSDDLDGISYANGGAGADTFEVLIDEGVEFEPGFFTDIDLTGILESLPEDNVVGLNGFNLTDFEPGVDVLQVEAISVLDGYTLLNARLEADGTEATNLILRYERAGDLTRDVHIAISATGVDWDDISFVGATVPTALPLGATV